MDIHRYEKIWIAISVLLIIGLITSIVYGVTAKNIGTVRKSHQHINSNNLSNTKFANPGGHWAGPNHYVVHVVGRQWLWQPGSSNPIMVPTNTTVTFYVTSADVVHGFEVVGSKVNVMAIPGQVNKFSTKFNHPKSYGIICNEYCGAGHQNMQGQLVAVPRSTLKNNTTGTNVTSSNTKQDLQAQSNSADGLSLPTAQSTSSGEHK